MLSKRVPTSSFVRVLRQDMKPSIQILRGATGRTNVKKRWTGEFQNQTRVTKQAQKYTNGENTQVPTSRAVTSNILDRQSIPSCRKNIQVTYINESADWIALFKIPIASSSLKWWKQRLKIRHSFLLPIRGTARASTGVSMYEMFCCFFEIRSHSSTCGWRSLNMNWIGGLPWASSSPLSSDSSTGVGPPEPAQMSRTVYDEISASCSLNILHACVARLP